MSVNNVMLLGRLVADPKVVYTKNGTAMLSFTLALNRQGKQKDGKNEADFVRVVFWNQTAEFLGNSGLSKGQRIHVEGSIRTGSYMGKDGTKKYTFDVWGRNFEFVEAKGSGGVNEANPSVPAGFRDMAEEIIDF